MLKIANVFSNHMVLQRDKNIAVWGECDQTKVTGECNGKKVTTSVEDGRFMLYFPPMEAGGPYDMKITCDGAEVAYHDIMIGEVWFAGGQSNMELELQNSFEGAKAVEAVVDENVRYYYAPKKPFEGEELDKELAKTSWELPTKENAGRWSAVAYYYARELSRKLGVCVGIIGCNWGGTSASCWMSREMLLESDKTRSYVDEYDAIVKDQDYDAYVKEREEYIIYQTEFEKNVSHYYETCEHPTWDEAISLFGENKYPGPMGPLSEFRPSGLYQTMVSRLIPYTIAGFIYYQGEEDDHKPTTYYELLSALIKQWRKDWNDETLPFLVVQLPVFQNEGEPDFKNWPLIREAQMRVYQTIKNTGIAVILENGEYGNIHPTRKEPVGKRLAKQALYHVYQLIGEEEAFGPVYQSSYVQDQTMVLQFAHCKDGFDVRGELKGFELAGPDKNYQKADAVIEGSQILVKADTVKEPKYVRYAWTNYQEITLFGKNGIPVAPFRTSRLDGSCVTGSRLSNEGVM